MSVFVGTAGWSLRVEHKTLFAQGSSHLARYATRFNAVEINSSFYRPHRRTTYQRWAASVPPGFRFAVKMPRSITHQARLRDCEGPLDAFLNESAGLGKKRGPLLVQLPPSLALESAADTFFIGLRRRDEGEVACEPRHASWFGREGEALLAAHHIARVAADPALVPSAAHPGGWNGFAYYRWHGSPVMYRSDYAPEKLVELARRLSDGDWCVFDNTADGAATGDALEVSARWR